MEAVLNWILRAVFVAFGVGAALWIAAWLRETWRGAEERWPLRLAVGMLVLAGVYTVGHARLLAERDEIEEGRRAYTRYGDPRRTELRRAEVRGWILGCEGEDALALYRASDGVVERHYPLGAAGANLVGGGPDADERDYTVERLFADHLREPRSLAEAGELHPAGSDLRLTLCPRPTAAAGRLLRESGLPGAVVVQDVRSGALVAYASTGGPDQPPLGIKEYAAPGSIFKLALAAVWWENQLPDTVMSCQSSIRLSTRATIRNSEGFSIPEVSAPHEMLVYSCNTTAVRMAMLMRERLGTRPFAEAYRRFGFQPYAADDDAPRGVDRDFWASESDAWVGRMSPPPSRVRLSDDTGTDEWGQLAIGQGPLDATVIQVSRFLQAIGNDGVMVRPSIEASADADGGERVMSEATAERLLRAMREVVDRGTARSTRPALEGLEWDLAGKTGTAQVAGRADNGWFAGLVLGPDGEPRYTVVVFLRGGGPGGRAPARIAAGLTRVLASGARPGETG